MELLNVPYVVASAICSKECRKAAWVHVCLRRIIAACVHDFPAADGNLGATGRGKQKRCNQHCDFRLRTSW